MGYASEPCQDERDEGQPGLLRREEGGGFGQDERDVSDLSSYQRLRGGRVGYSVAVESESVKKSAVVEDMSGVPLSLTNDGVTDGSNFIDVQGEGMRRRASWVEDEVLKDAEDATSSNLCPGGVLDGCKSL